MCTMQWQSFPLSSENNPSVLHEQIFASTFLDLFSFYVSPRHFTVNGLLAMFTLLDDKTVFSFCKNERE